MLRRLSFNLLTLGHRYAFYVFTIAPIDANAPDAQNAAQNPLVIPTFLALYIFGVIYQLVLTWDALRLKNTIQIIGLCIYNIGLLAYGVVEIFQIKDIKGDVDTPQVSAVASVFFVGSLILGFVAWKLYHEFAWTVYKHISADLRMKRRYLDYQVRKEACEAFVVADFCRSTSHCSSSISSFSLASPFSSLSLLRKTWLHRKNLKNTLPMPRYR